MASNLLPVPQPLEIHDSQAAEKWKRFKRAWNSYSLATGLDAKTEKVQVATLLTVIGEEAREVFATFTWEEAEDNSKINKVLTKFEQYCQPRRNVPFERYRFNRRMQEPGESYDQYRTALLKLAEGCSFETITSKEILRDRLVFGIKDQHAREKLLRKANLTLADTDDICHSHEATATQMKIVEEVPGTVNVIDTRKEPLLKGTPGTAELRECRNCGRKHEFSKRELCPAFGKMCNKCRKPNHFAVKCRTRSSKFIRAVEENDAEEVFQTSASGVSVDDSQCVTLQLDSGHYLQFQVDTGAQCNVVPIDLYKKATKDYKLSQVKPVRQKITAYGGSELRVVGRVLLRVRRGDFKCRLDCKLVGQQGIRPLLGRKACIGMKIVAYLDNDQLNKPSTKNAEVYAVGDDESSQVTKEQLIQKYPSVFANEVGLLEGEYHIRLDPQADPIQHAPRRVPVARREGLRETLDDLVKREVLAPVTRPTPWVSSMVAVDKPDGRMRICLDPKELNEAIQREHYQLPTIEEVATRLHGAKLFSVLDARNGFWHIMLDEASSFLTTFNTPFGRYRWKRMPFGISSAPEVFQRRMCEVVEGLKGVEIVADDLVVVGFGDTPEEAMRDHNQNLHAVLQRCKEENLKLNDRKLRLCLKEVPFIGHLLTPEGLCVDPNKVKAILDMPPPSDVAAVQRLLGLAQYLSKFLPHLSDVMKPLRELTKKEVAWMWDPIQQQALENLKKAVSSTPVLRYYNLQEEVTLQCDASQSGLGATLMQNGQPVAYASRALTPTETRYAQIEKELLAIVFGCEHFEAYTYGRDVVQVETDHQPLESIMRKPLHSAPSRLQRMLLRLQKFNLKVKYKKGKEMFLADTLSRAHLTSVHACSFAQELQEVDHTTSLAMPAAQLQRVKDIATTDSVITALRDIIQRGWPNTKSGISENLYPYFDIRDELIVQDNLIFKGSQLVIPATMRREMMSLTHASHIGIEGCIRRARETMYWPRMSSELKEYISKCDICMAHRSMPGKEPLKQHEFAERPWAKVGADLCDYSGRILLVVCDYYSNFIEVEHLNRATTNTVSKALRTMFARYGVPDVLISDNGPQFASEEFDKFAKKWGFEHVTSSPHYPQSNGKAENAVKTVKRLFSKCRESNCSEFLALLDWRNTPTEGFDSSPAQRFFGRRCKTLLPTHGTLLAPQYSTKGDTQAINRQKQRQQHYYDHHTKPLKPLTPGESVRMRLPGEKTWSPGVCEGLVGPRSYEVKVGDRIFVRNRRHLIKSDDLVAKDVPEVEEATQPESGETLHPQESAPNPVEEIPPPQPSGMTPARITPTPPSTGPRRSSRTNCGKRPDYFGNCV